MSIYKLCKDIERKTMSPAKKAMAKNDYFAFYVGRPLSYLLTVPFVKTNITPNQISYLSIIPLIVGFIIMIFTTDFVVLLLAWFLVFFMELTRWSRWELSQISGAILEGWKCSRCNGWLCSHGVDVFRCRNSSCSFNRLRYLYNPGCIIWDFIDFSKVSDA